MEIKLAQHLFSPKNTWNRITSYNVCYTKLLRIESISDEELSLPTDLVFGPNGTLFVASYGNDQILEFNVTDNNSLQKFALPSEGISYPIGLAISPDSGELYVSSSENDEITRHALLDVSQT